MRKAPKAQKYFSDLPSTDGAVGEGQCEVMLCGLPGNGELIRLTQR